MTSPLTADVVARRVQDLPALPDAIAHVLVELRRDKLHIDRCAALIERDQALCGRTLRLANSPFYGRSGRIGSMRDAIQLLGLGTIGTLMTAAQLSFGVDASQCAGFDFRRFVRHAIAVSIAARELAQLCGEDPNEAGLAGLLHDVGQLALAVYFPVELAAALELAASTDCPVNEAERALLNLDHAEVGGIVARHWCFPPDMAEAIERHHDISRAGPADASTPLCDIVHLADVIVHGLDIAHHPDESVPAISVDAWHRLHIATLPMAALFASVERGAGEVCAELGL